MSLTLTHPTPVQLSVLYLKRGAISTLLYIIKSQWWVGITRAEAPRSGRP